MALIPRLLVALGCLFTCLTVACGDDKPPEPTRTATSTPAEAFVPSNLYTPPPYLSPTPGPPFPHTPVSVPDDWDTSAIWTAYFDSSELYDQCVPALEMDCVIRVAIDEGVSPQGIAFIEQYETVLVGFNELGAVDFGQVAWPGINMGRPEPVIFNGDFGLTYYGRLIPEDWHEADPSYAALPTGEQFDPYPWAEYSQLADAYSEGGAQHIVVDTVVQFCRACAPLAFMPLDLTFRADGTPTGVKVLPMKCESEAFPRMEKMAEGPCNPP